MSKKSINSSLNKKVREPLNHFDDNFLHSKDLALQPITFFFESDCALEEISSKARHLSLNTNELKKKKTSKNKRKSKKSIKSNKSQKSKKSSQKSQDSQKSTSNTNKKKVNQKNSIKDSCLYNSNIVIIHQEDDDCSSSDPIEKEVAKLKKLMSKSRDKKNKKTNKVLINLRNNKNQ